MRIVEDEGGGGIVGEGGYGREGREEEGGRRTQQLGQYFLGDLDS